MNEEAQRVAIAEACGWRLINGFIAKNNVPVVQVGTLTKKWSDCHHKDLAVIPDYLNDLNAMHEAEKVLSLSQRDQYQQWLYRIVEKEPRMAPIYWLAINSTAKQRAEAFLRTIGKWEEHQ